MRKWFAAADHQNQLDEVGEDYEPNEPGVGQPVVVLIIQILGLVDDLVFVFFLFIYIVEVQLFNEVIRHIVEVGN